MTNQETPQPVHTGPAVAVARRSDVRKIWRRATMVLMFALLSMWLATAVFGQDSASSDTTSDKTNANSESVEQETAAEANTAESSEQETSPSITDVESDRKSTVGYPNRIEQIVIPGSELVSIDIVDRTQPMILRVIQSFPHGDDFRYDLEYTGLEEGTFNLADYLKRADSSPLGDLPEINVTIGSALAENQILPIELRNVKTGYHHYYIALLVVGGAIWLAGLLAILFAKRGRQRRPVEKQKVTTVAERLKPLIDQAVKGELRTPEAAELERVLNAFWSKKLRLEHLTADQLRKKLRDHEDASQLLNAMDHWLHRPDADPNVDVAALLQPYQSELVESS